MREGACPYCERTVLVYEEPPRCPLCACPLDEHSVHPYVFPQDRVPEAE
jgi:predicted amidophosphoribosyltransferase